MSTRKSAQKTPAIIDEESDIGSDVESDIEEIEEELEEIDQPSKDIDDEEDEEEAEADEEQSIIVSKRIALQHLQTDAANVTIVAPEKRITSEYMTLYEYSKVVGTRATHISNGAPLYIDPSGISCAREIAIKEVDMKVCPLVVIRKTRNKRIEHWEVNEMTKPLV